MRRILLSVGVPAGVLRFAKENRPAIFRTRRFLFPKAAANLKKTCRAASLFLVCPPGLEPGPGASEGVKSYTLCIFLRFFFDFLHIFMLSLV